MKETIRPFVAILCSCKIKYKSVYIVTAIKEKTMETIKIKRKISSSNLRIRELEKFMNKDVEIVITPYADKQKHKYDELLSISQWDISKNTVKVENWQIESY